MTAPAGITIPYTITPGAPPAPLTDAGNAPAGLLLVNRGDNAGTVWVQAGPTGGAGAVPLGPGASMQWTDRAVLPYAYMTAGATLPEVLVLTNQSEGYTNPTTVAVATASQLAADGIPSVFMERIVFDGNVASGDFQDFPDVGGYASLVIIARWAPNPTASAAALGLSFTAPKTPGFFPTAVPVFLNMDCAREQSAGIWQVPVVAGRLIVTNMTNLSNMPVRLTVVGTNRTAPRTRQLGGESGVASFTAVTPVAGTTYPLASAAVVGGSVFTRFNGPVSIMAFSSAGAGLLLPRWADESARGVSGRIRVGAGDTLIQQWNHPSVPVNWSFIPDTSVAGSFLTLYIAAS